MKNRRNLLLAATVAGLVGGTTFAAPSENFKVFLCFGQSNMSGGSGVTPNKDEDKKTNPRIFTVGFGSCQGWSDGKWAAAKEPLHCGDNINAMGPAFAFGRMMADSLKDDTIGIVPCGLYGRPLECWLKDGNNMGSGGPIPGIESGAKSAYNWMLNRCKYAQERGVIAGIVMHQGESNNGDGTAYLSKIKKLYNNLKTDLGLKADIPYIAGELRGDAQAVQKNPNNSKFNDVLKNIKDSIPFGYVASSKDCGTYSDQWILHFNQEGYRLMGQRMAVEMLKGLREIAKTDVVPQQRVISTATLTTQRDSKVYSLDGRFVSTGVALKGVVRTSLRPGNLYVVAGKSAGASVKLMVAPTAR